MKNKIVPILCLVLLVICGFSLSACTAKVGSADYTVAEAQRAYYVDYGNVQSVRMVELHSEDSNVGTGIGVGAVAGGITGAVIGGLIGGSTGATIGLATGAVAGGAAGGAIGHNTGHQTGLEITVRLDNGQTVAVVQGADVNFYPGQRVQLITGGNKTRVAPL